MRLPAGVFCAQGVAGPHRAAYLRGGGARRHRVLQRAAGVPPWLRLHRLYGRPDRRAASGTEKRGGCALRLPGGSERPALRRAAGCADLRRHLPRRQSGYQGARLPAGRVHRGKGRGRFPHLHRHRGRDGRLHAAGRDPQPRREPGSVQRRAFPAHHRHTEQRAPVELRAPHPVHPDHAAHPPRHRRSARPGAGRKNRAVRLPHRAVRGRRAVPERTAGGAARP